MPESAGNLMTACSGTVALHIPGKLHCRMQQQYCAIQDASRIIFAQPGAGVPDMVLVAKYLQLSPLSITSPDNPRSDNGKPRPQKVLLNCVIISSRRFHLFSVLVLSETLGHLNLLFTSVFLLLPFDGLLSLVASVRFLVVA